VIVAMKDLTLAGGLALLYLVPALLLFVLLLACFSGRAVCSETLYSLLPLSPLVRALEWPWGEIAPPAMFTGPVFGKLFVLAAIAINGATIFAIAKLGSSLASLRFAHPRTLPAVAAASELTDSARAALRRANQRIAGAWRRDPPRIAGSIGHSSTRFRRCTSTSTS
jgi:hypothetical protein